MLASYEELDEAADQIMEYITDVVDGLQTRITDLNLIHEYVKHDDAMMLKYGPPINERFGMINVLTKNVDTITMSLERVLNGEYEFYPGPALGALLLEWDYQIYNYLQEIENIITELEKYMEYFAALDVDIDLGAKDSNPTIH